ncbi:hypothetical protein G6F56_014252 [Rhizopus delemar]|nr:hypothetical protein G6F56_014252 [Rhizopus delemar]
MVGSSHAALGSSLCSVPIEASESASVLSNSQLFGSGGQADSEVNGSSDVDEDNLESGESEDDDDTVRGNRQLQQPVV